MPSIKKEFIERILERSRKSGQDLVDIIESYTNCEPRKEGASYKFPCPLCKSDHSLVVTPGKGVFKCFNCNGLSGKSPVDFLMKGQKMSYPEAIAALAGHYNMVMEYEYEKPRPVVKAKGKSFCKKMLEESGLTPEDITASVRDTSDTTTRYKQETFTRGTINSRGDIDESADDVIIHYYDLDGLPITFIRENDKTATERRYQRIRYQYPAEHLDKGGRPIKYRSPAGAPTFIYIPQKIRALYQAKAPINTLYIQEGEKKAEKACKHGIDSVAISGIQNLGYKGTLPEEIVKLVEVCQVKEVIFLLDSDCFDLTSHIKIDDPIDRRPKNFFYAVRSYKEYFNKLKNRELYVELYFGYVLKNEAGDKGVDDILTNTLKNKEDALKNDILKAKNEKNLTGQYIKLHKISTITDSKISEIWSLHSNKEFCHKYIDQLRGLPEFTIGKRRFRFNEKDELESAQPVEQDEKFWTEVFKPKSNTTDYNFSYVGCKAFLEHRGFYRYRTPSGDFDFIHIEAPVVKTIKHWEISDFVKGFTKDCLPKDVLEMLLKGHSQYFGPVSMTMLDFIDLNLYRPSRGVHRFFFRDKWWHITADNIKEETYPQLHEIIWDEQMKRDHNPSLLKNLINIKKQDGKYSYNITSLGRKCHFLSFLENASNFTWRKEQPSQEELNENAQHLVSKLAAFGFLVASIKDKAISKAVVGMDGKQSEVGVSNGRSGKSLLGEAVKAVVNSRYFNGKEMSAKNTNQFAWDGVTEKIKTVFIDDAMKDFDFETLFGLITGDWPVNPKGGTPYILPFTKSPKIYLTTNHAIGGSGSSFIDRQWPIAFSDYYNDSHKPTDDFGLLFFDEWDSEQWGLFWNLVAQSVQIYFKYGYVPAAGERLELRKLRQDIGEEFILWADEYFSDDTRLNHQIKRKDIYEDLLAYVGSEKKRFYTAQAFKTKIKNYCIFRGYYFNPELYNPTTNEYRTYDKDGNPNLDIKRNGIEYFTIGGSDYYELHTVSSVFTPNDDLPE